MTGTGESVDIQEMIAHLSENARWKKLPSPISSCIRKRNRLASEVDLTLALSIVLSFLLLLCEFIGTPIGDIPQGFSGLFRARIAVSSLILAFLIICLCILVFASSLRFAVCHSLGMQMVIRELGTGSPDFPEVYRKSAMAPLVRAKPSRILSVLAVIISALTPIIVRQYSGVVSLDVVDLEAIISLGVAFLCGGLVSELQVNRTLTRYERMSDAELRADGELLAIKNHEKVLRWLRGSVLRKAISSLTDEQLEPLVRLWYEEYFFRDADTMVSHEQLLDSLTRERSRSIPLLIFVFGLIVAMAWILTSLIIVLLHLPAPSV
jgi:hypothetical protein